MTTHEIPDAILEDATQAAERACAIYGQRTSEGNIELSMDDLDMIADAIRAAAPIVAAQAWDEGKQAGASVNEGWEDTLCNPYGGTR